MREGREIRDEGRGGSRETESCEETGGVSARIRSFGLESAVRVNLVVVWSDFSILERSRKQSGRRGGPASHKLEVPVASFVRRTALRKMADMDCADARLCCWLPASHATFLLHTHPTTIAHHRKLPDDMRDGRLKSHRNSLFTRGVSSLCVTRSKPRCSRRSRATPRSPSPPHSSSWAASSPASPRAARRPRLSTSPPSRRRSFPSRRSPRTTPRPRRSRRPPRTRRRSASTRRRRSRSLPT